MGNTQRGMEELLIIIEHCRITYSNRVELILQFSKKLLNIFSKSSIERKFLKIFKALVVGL